MSNYPNADSGSQCNFARSYESNGATVIDDFTVGTSGTDIVVESTTFQNAVAISATSLTIKKPVV